MQKERSLMRKRKKIRSGFPAKDRSAFLFHFLHSRSTLLPLRLLIFFITPRTGKKRSTILFPTNLFFIRLMPCSTGTGCMEKKDLFNTSLSCHFQAKKDWSAFFKRSVMQDSDLFSPYSKFLARS